MKDKILEAAKIAIETQGVMFKMEDLAKNLNISKRTLYEHFSSKQEIIETIINNLVNDFHKVHHAILIDTTLTIEEKLIKYFSYRSTIFSSLKGEYYRELYIKMPDVLEFCTKRTEKDWQELKEFLWEAQKKGQIRNVDIDTAILMMKGLIQLIFYDNSKSLDECYQYYLKGTDIILKGIIR